MNRIQNKFRELRREGRKGFVAYITAGDPNLKITERLVTAMEEAGVDIIELGIPFSDPMADGLTNQRSSERALKTGVTLRDILQFIKQLRCKTQIPVALFTYLNPVFKYGWERFAKDAKNCGVDGVLVLDLPVEESKENKKALSRNGISMIYLLAPTSTESRIKETCKNASGFIYYVSRAGVTGIRSSVESGVRPMVNKIKHFTKLPVAVGFGISTPRQVKEVSRYADAVVVGSAIVNKIEENLGKKDLVKKIGNFVKTLTPHPSLSPMGRG